MGLLKTISASITLNSGYPVNVLTLLENLANFNNLQIIDISPRLVRGFPLLSADEKSHHENVMAKFKFTANFADAPECLF